jgi:DNA-binding LytR/AlgR family response regulator
MRAIDKARLLIEMKRSIAPSDGFRVAADCSFFIKEKNSFVKINYADVVYIESLGDFVNIILQGVEKKIALVSLKNLEQQLPAAQFVRISRTLMVNKSKITAIDNGTVSLDKIVLTIGKTYSETVLQSVLGNAAIKRFI